MAAGVANDSLVPAMIQSCRVIDVDGAAWTMDLRAEVGDRRFTKISIPSVYTHPFGGEGIHFMPEVGSYVWAAVPSDSNKAIPLIFKGLGDQSGGNKANRPDMNPGDLALVGRDGNGVKVRRGGVVEIYSTPLARTIYLPLKNKILTFAENYDLETIGGCFRWDTARGEEDPDLKKGTKLTIGAREFAGDPQFTVQLLLGGQIEKDGDQVLDLKVYQDSSILPIDLEENPLEESVHLTMDRKSRVRMRLGDDEGHFEVYKDRENAEGVMLGRTFLEEVDKAMAQIESNFVALGLPFDQVTTLRNKIATSLEPNKGGAPLISTHMRTD